MAWMFAAFWFGALTLLVRVAPAPEPMLRATPAPVSWWPAEGGGSESDIRTLWTPSVFALSTPAGFSHSLRRERSRLAPPVQSSRPAPAFLEEPTLEFLDLAAQANIRRVAPQTGIDPLLVDESVFPPRVQEQKVPRMDFPDGWESRLFSGIDLNFDRWTNRAWSARIEMQFDKAGVSASMLLAQSSGLPELDRRLARSANGWRLLEPAAPRTGVVSWSSPGASSASPASPPRTAAAKKGAS